MKYHVSNCKYILILAFFSGSRNHPLKIELVLLIFISYFIHAAKSVHFDFFLAKLFEI
jgi:hypothetical protein